MSAILDNTCLFKRLHIFKPLIQYFYNIIQYFFKSLFKSLNLWDVPVTLMSKTFTSDLLSQCLLLFSVCACVRTQFVPLCLFICLFLLLLLYCPFFSKSNWTNFLLQYLKRRKWKSFFIFLFIKSAEHIAQFVTTKLHRFSNWVNKVFISEEARLTSLTDCCHAY